MKSVLALIVMVCASLAQAADQTWDQLIAAARKEGKLVIMGPPDPKVRQDLPAAFKARYGINVEYIGGRSAETATKLRAERSAGLYSTDIALSGIQTMATIFYREKMLAPIKPALMPELLDGKKWKSGKPWFMDPDDQYILRLFNVTGPLISINTSQVRPDEIRSMQDLLLPKWKGKIMTLEPTVPGTGSNDAARIYLHLGDAYFKRLYIDQKPVTSREQRQLLDWLARGTYPIAFGIADGDLESLRKDGMPLQQIYDLSDFPGTLTAGFGLVAMFNNAPHPNAAKLFANWIAGKEGMETYSRALGYATTRTDIDERSYLDPKMIPDPNRTYFDTYDWQFTVTTKEQTRLYMKDLLKR